MHNSIPRFHWELYFKGFLFLIQKRASCNYWRLIGWEPIARITVCLTADTWVCIWILILKYQALRMRFFGINYSLCSRTSDLIRSFHKFYFTWINNLNVLLALWHKYITLCCQSWFNHDMLHVDSTIAILIELGLLARRVFCWLNMYGMNLPGLALDRINSACLEYWIRLRTFICNSFNRFHAIRKNDLLWHFDVKISIVLDIIDVESMNRLLMLYGLLTKVELSLSLSLGALRLSLLDLSVSAY